MSPFLLMIIFYKYVIDNYQPLHQLIVVQPMSYDRLTWSKSKFINILDHQINEKSTTIIHFYIYLYTSLISWKDYFFKRTSRHWWSLTTIPRYKTYISSPGLGSQAIKNSISAWSYLTTSSCTDPIHLLCKTNYIIEIH
jgi:hypothetical protein